jgi:hypothetical protein
MAIGVAQINQITDVTERYAAKPTINITSGSISFGLGFFGKVISN